MLLEGDASRNVKLYHQIVCLISMMSLTVSIFHLLCCIQKRIQDAFTSKKRLTKEYEQLAIWFGDTDINSSQETLSNMKNLQTHDACDSEWELL